MGKDQPTNDDDLASKSPTFPSILRSRRNRPYAASPPINPRTDPNVSPTRSTRPLRFSLSPVRSDRTQPSAPHSQTTPTSSLSPPGSKSALKFHRQPTQIQSTQYPINSGTRLRTATTAPAAPLHATASIAVPNRGAIRRSSSTTDSLHHANDHKSTSLSRTRSERLGARTQRRAQTHDFPPVTTRGITRRWSGDLPGPRPQPPDEELDAFFRFFDNITRTVWTLLCAIPTAIAKIPRWALSILQHIFPFLKQRHSLPPAEETRRDTGSPSH